ncbi:hypothetical protein J437_LFUL013883 [Ladona fulva]|uniref:PiggyBac transposable element-derived protein domain-containing protein n=1 Tax=Ladona fulva TaxID=123851 RepID=A0A8K0KML2_LADFU|nr:hypothetical protein J437_LFUL013883 [Ladona fulva]
MPACVILWRSHTQGAKEPHVAREPRKLGPIALDASPLMYGEEMEKSTREAATTLRLGKELQENKKLKEWYSWWTSGPSAREQAVGSTNTTKWKDLPSSRTNIPFNRPFGMKTPPSEETLHLFAYFLLLFSDNFFDLIVKQTNDYAKHVLSENVRSCISLWKKTITAEMKVVISELFLMGIIRLSNEGGGAQHHTSKQANSLPGSLINRADRHDVSCVKPTFPPSISTLVAKFSDVITLKLGLTKH